MASECSRCCAPSSSICRSTSTSWTTSASCRVRAHEANQPLPSSLRCGSTRLTSRACGTPVVPGDTNSPARPPIWNDFEVPPCLHTLVGRSSCCLRHVIAMLMNSACCWSQSTIKVEEEGFAGLTEIERHDFYERARSAYAVVATSETAIYANIILKKVRRSRWHISLSLSLSLSRSCATDPRDVMLRALYTMHNERGCDSNCKSTSSNDSHTLPANQPTSQPANQPAPRWQQ